MATVTPFLLLALLFFASVHQNSAKTTRTATAIVINRTCAPIYALSLIHKYSNVFSSHHEYWRLRDGNRTTSGKGTVRYNTGFLTTGRDWWRLTWYDRTFTTKYYSNPNNFRGLIDGLEGVAPSILNAAAKAAASAAAATAGPGAQIAAAAAAKKLAAATSAALFNSATTKGFKQHILRKSDQNRLVRIYVYRNGRIRITSPSGTSRTVYSSTSTGFSLPRRVSRRPRRPRRPAPRRPAPRRPVSPPRSSACTPPSSGDAAVGIAKVHDSRCPSFVGCLNDRSGCRFCKVTGRHTAQNKHLAAC